MKVLIGTHAFHLHLVDFDPATSTITKVSDIKLREQPSYALRHPIHKDLFYVTAWVESIIYVIRVDEKRGGFEVLGQAQSGGGGPTHFVLSPDGESLIMANVSVMNRRPYAEIVRWLIHYASSIDQEKSRGSA
jgi:6-phosphogluconolactonase (cycloisomerase 2 family)